MKPINPPVKKISRIMASPLKKPHFQAFQAGSRLTAPIIINAGIENRSNCCIKKGLNSPAIKPGINVRRILKKGISFQK